MRNSIKHCSTSILVVSTICLFGVNSKAMASENIVNNNQNIFSPDEMHSEDESTVTLFSYTEDDLNSTDNLDCIQSYKNAIIDNTEINAFDFGNQLSNNL